MAKNTTQTDDEKDHQEERYQHAIKLYDGNRTEAVAIMKELAERGHSGALADLGYMYKLGIGVEQDDKKVFGYDLQAACCNRFYAYHVLDHYSDGKGVENCTALKDIWRNIVEGRGPSQDQQALLLASLEPYTMLTNFDGIMEYLDDTFKLQVHALVLRNEHLHVWNNAEKGAIANLANTLEPSKQGKVAQAYVCLKDIPEELQHIIVGKFTALLATEAQQQQNNGKSV